MKRFAELKNATPGDLPAWLRKADIQEAVVEVDDRGRVVWKDGLWKNGLWKGYVWQGGVWKDGKWDGGRWMNGLWMNGEWKDGVWKDGVWLTGIWLDGTWEGGIWNDGAWSDGIWKDGRWVGGIWGGGEWCGGRELTTREISATEEPEAAPEELESDCMLEAEEIEGMTKIQLLRMMDDFGIVPPIGSNKKELVRIALAALHGPGDSIAFTRVESVPPVGPTTIDLSKALSKKEMPEFFKEEAEGRVDAFSAELDSKLKKASKKAAGTLEKRRAMSRAEKLKLKAVLDEKREKAKPKAFESPDDLAAHLFGD